MTSELLKELHKARPKLRTVTPLAHAVLLVYAFFNIFLGVSLFVTIDQSRITSPLLIVNDVFSYKFWGVLFVVLGLFKLFALKTNNWDLSRKSLLVGVAIKAAWALALVVRSTANAGTWLITLMWLALAAVQIVTFIFFMPPAVQTTKQPKGDNE